MRLIFYLRDRSAELRPAIGEADLACGLTVPAGALAASCGIGVEALGAEGS